MSTTQVQWRRGTEAENAAFAGATGEITIDLTNYRIHVHDGTGTFGGWTGARHLDLINLSGYLSSLIGNGTTIVYKTGEQNISGIKHFDIISANSISGTGYMYDSINVKSVNWNGRTLYDTNGNQSVNWNTYLLYSLNMTPSVGWNTRKLYDISGSTILSWGTGFSISQSLNLSVSLNNSASVSLTNKSFYSNTYTGQSTYTLPPINSCTGRIYYIKNRGGIITLTGTYPDEMFSSTRVANFSIGSGYAYQLINDGQYWNVT